MEKEKCYFCDSKFIYAMASGFIYCQNCTAAYRFDLNEMIPCAHIDALTPTLYSYKRFNFTRVALFKEIRPCIMFSGQSLRYCARCNEPLIKKEEIKDA